MRPFWKALACAWTAVYFLVVGAVVVLGMTAGAASTTQQGDAVGGALVGGGFLGGSVFVIGFPVWLVGTVALLLLAAMSNQPDTVARMMKQEEAKRRRR